MTTRRKDKPRTTLKLHYFKGAYTYDPEADAAYIYLNGERAGKGSAAATHSTNHRSLYIDMDRGGRVLGLEVLGAPLLPAFKALTLLPPKGKPKP